MVFCNVEKMYVNSYELDVTILILVDGFLQSVISRLNTLTDIIVTILILVDGFLQ